MINRDNYSLVQDYLEYKEYLQRDPETVKRARIHLRHLLEWANETPLAEAQKIRPSFPAYLTTVRNDKRKGSLAPETMRKACIEVRQFITWARIRDPRSLRRLDDEWIKSIKPDRENSPEAQLVEREYYTLEEIRQLCNFEPQTLKERRDRANIALDFLSAMRAGALVTLPIRCVHLREKCIWQLPSEGVKTKFSRAAKTFLLPIDDLLDIVWDWDQFVRTELGEDGLWYPLVNTDGTAFDLQKTPGCKETRRQGFAHGLEYICNRQGVPYRSPHKIRNGHAIYEVKTAVRVEQLKACSQNLMHRSFGIFWDLYGRLKTDDVREVILRLGKEEDPNQSQNQQDLAAQLILQTVNILKDEPGLLKKLLHGEIEN